jgi:hypothetical protein
MQTRATNVFVLLFGYLFYGSTPGDGFSYELDAVKPEYVKQTFGDGIVRRSRRKDRECLIDVRGGW